MQHWDSLGLEGFLSVHPGIRIAELNDDSIALSGRYHLRAQLAGRQLVDKIYQLRVIIPRAYPEELPRVIDEGRYIPRSQEYHTYTDGSFCLGSEFRIKFILQNDHSLTAFFEKIIDRFLYAVTHRIEFGDFPFGELSHGEQGLVDDYGEMFGISGKLAVLRAFRALGRRKRESNKLPCPCDCGLRLGLCDYRFTLADFRKIARRRWFRQHLKESFKPLEKPKKKSRSTGSTGKKN